MSITLNASMNTANQVNSKPQTSMNSSQKFGSVFGQILSHSQIQPNTTSNVIPEGKVIQDLLAILNVNSIEELEALVGSDELTVNVNELKELLDKLLATGSDNDISEDLPQLNVWDLLAGIQEQANKIVDAVSSSVNGQGPSSLEAAKQAVQLLKSVQLIGSKSDLTINQESALFDLKQLLMNVKENIVKIPSNDTTSLPQLIKQPDILNHMVVKQASHSIQQEVVTDTKEITSNIQGTTTTLVQTKVEAISVTLPSDKAAQSEEFIKELQKVMNRVQFGYAGGANRLVLKLFPEQLGTIRIELIQKDGMLTAKILASTALGKEMLDSNSSQLRQGFTSQNILLDRLEITQSLQESTRQEKNHDFQHSFKQQQEQQQQEHRNEELEEQTSFQEYLEEMEV